jgi:hypothetical protein
LTAERKENTKKKQENGKGMARKMQRTKRGKGGKRERRNEEMKNKSMKK